MKIHEYRLGPDGSEELVLSEQIQEEIQTSDGYYLIQLYIKIKNKERIQQVSNIQFTGCCENSLFSPDPFLATEDFCINSDGIWHSEKRCSEVGKESEVTTESSIETRFLEMQSQLNQLSTLINQNFMRNDIFLPDSNFNRRSIRKNQS